MARCHAGAVVTAILFTIGKFLIGMYLGKASFSSSYGAAGSLVIVLVWVYYSAQIFSSAPSSRRYACEHGSDPLCSRRESKDQAGSKAIPTPDRRTRRNQRHTTRVTRLPVTRW